MSNGHGHGGKRRGAGRRPKPSSEHCIKQTITLPPELLRELNQLIKELNNNDKAVSKVTRSGWIADAIRDKLKLVALKS